MPYLIKRTGPGDSYKVEVHGKYLSKKGLPLERAKKQRIAVILNEKRHSGGFKYRTKQGRLVDRPLTPYQKQFFNRGIGVGLHIADKGKKIPIRRRRPHLAQNDNSPPRTPPQSRQRTPIRENTPEMEHASPQISHHSTPVRIILPPSERIMTPKKFQHKTNYESLTHPMAAYFEQKRGKGK